MKAGAAGLRDTLHDEQRSRAFYETVWPHRAAVMRVATILMGNVADAEDLAQDAMLKAFKSIERFASGTDAKAWLMTILRNARIDRLRASGAGIAGATVSLESLGSDLPDAPPSDRSDTAALTPQDVLEGFSDEELIAALQRLPEEIRWTLLLVEVEGRSHEEAAAILDVPVGTIKSRAHRGRGMLRAALLPLARDRRLIRD